MCGEGFLVFHYSKHSRLKNVFNAFSFILFYCVNAVSTTSRSKIYIYCATLINNIFSIRHQTHAHGFLLIKQIEDVVYTSLVVAKEQGSTNSISSHILSLVTASTNRKTLHCLPKIAYQNNNIDDTRYGYTQVDEKMKQQISKKGIIEQKKLQREE